MTKQLTAVLALLWGLAPCTAPAQSGIRKADDQPAINIYSTFNDIRVDARRELRYRPDGNDFVGVNGKRKFNRALYGAHTGFRLEASDMPEFGLFLPHMGGNLLLGIARDGRQMAMGDAERVEMRYRAGSVIYTVTDPLLENGRIVVTALVMRDRDGALWKIDTEQLPAGVELTWRFGGVSGTRFTRNGDLGVDAPDCFDLKPEYCSGNVIETENGRIRVTSASGKHTVCGTFPERSVLHADSLPALHGRCALPARGTLYAALYPVSTDCDMSYAQLPARFAEAEKARAELASQVEMTSPDPYFNPVGGALAMAADGLWSGEAWLHGSIGWRTPYSGWRGAYAGDALGWHDRARSHFDVYADVQVRDVEPVYPHPTQGAAFNLARAEQKWGTQMYSNGYICRRPGHNDEMSNYDMNLCYIDELLWHFNWTGDTEYVRRMWPVLTAHLAWEKRNYDPDDDGLYDAYCCIWASDALYYNSGAVTHSSAYNYRANRMAAELAALIGEDGEPYRREAEKILEAMNRRLWIPGKGHWAEFQDFMGHRMLHEHAALWTIYHAVDSDTADPFQSYQATRYVDTQIPHIPVEADGLEKGYYVVSTTDWKPYAWSINNVAQAEIWHTALAYWQAGRNEEAFRMLKGSMLDCMYLGASPGNFAQISFYDAARGECYRDFGDPVGVISRTLVQGLYGVFPDALNGRVVLRPGFPESWDHASLRISDIDYSFVREGRTDTYRVALSFPRKLALELQLRARGTGAKVEVNGRKAAWRNIVSVTGVPMISIDVPAGEEPLDIRVSWSGKPIADCTLSASVRNGGRLSMNARYPIRDLYDPQQVLSQAWTKGDSLSSPVSGIAGHRTFFLKHKAGEMEWWAPVQLEITERPAKPYVQFGKVNAPRCETVDMDAVLNDDVDRIFRNEYLSPRSPYTTLQIPKQGMGEWCHPLETAEIEDDGFRSLVRDNLFTTSIGVPFRSFAEGHNVAYTSLWDNYPDRVEIPLTGRASNIYLLMAGSTNHMQYGVTNATLTVRYTDGSTSVTPLVNPDNWAPIEQDFYVDDYAFSRSSEPPYRLHLKSGIVSRTLGRELGIKGVYGRPIECGAATLVDIPADPDRQLQSITLETVANEVVVGIMAVTLQR